MGFSLADYLLSPDAFQVGENSRFNSAQWWAASTDNGKGTL